MKRVILRWLGGVPVADVIRMEDAHNDELLRHSADRAVAVWEAEQAVKRAESAQAGQVRVIERLLEDRMAGVV